MGEEKVNEAMASAGDMEVFNSRWDVAEFAFKSLSKDKALEAYGKILELTKLSSGKKLDVLMASSRVACFYGDWKKNVEILGKISNLSSNTTDWDRRNRLMIYNAISMLFSRDFWSASSLLLEGISTFSCIEMCPYEDFLAYTILFNTLHLSRTELKARIIDTSEIHTLSHVNPKISKIVYSLYDC